ncbi:protein MpTRIHELIX41 [Marchantia polymorpha subsp. ruderalis]|uniref:Myb/SANT-like DNA-binding domain-containing protein n=2 Tax=Marchantia polymorpha TaxID=3197 RepID=A0AAF6AV84_MARPO|nr:hypothetical protein MARPO_0002s0031 [Marchantia polymorpha]BBN00355.1 hypothetical protein Mp_1g28490 [Marchantia polymorpha subsp. ruderalis]|eukprot:PTQ49528.1 hypothetical protein MARPO_0002s0031 [Marchantia polymorpha]
MRSFLRSSSRALTLFHNYRSLMMGSTACGNVSPGTEGRGRNCNVNDQEQAPDSTVGVTDIALHYQRQSFVTSAPEPFGVMSVYDTIFLKTLRIVNEQGATLVSRVLERTFWATNEIEHLILMRTSADGLFKQGVKEKFSIMKLWDFVAGQLPGEGQARKDGKQCQWMWNMLMKEYTDVLTGAKEKKDFPHFEEMDQVWKCTSSADVERDLTCSPK